MNFVEIVIHRSMYVDLHWPVVPNFLVGWLDIRGINFYAVRPNIYIERRTSGQQ